MELLAAFVGGFLGMVGAFAGVWLANRYQSRAQKRQTLRDTTISLYTELTSVEMLTSRMKASKILDEIVRKHRRLPISELGANVDADFEDWFHVGRVLAFFQKFGAYLRTGYLNEELARELMGDIVLLWHDRYLANLVMDAEPTQIGQNVSLNNTSLDEWLKPYCAQFEKKKKQTRADRA